MRRCLPSVCLLVAIQLSTLASAQLPGAPAPKKSQAAARIARGTYLVENVAMCADCHSPRNERGEFVKAHWLWGAPLGFKNTVPMPRFASMAPPLAGLVGWTEQQGVTYLTTGKDREGQSAAPPMPEYRLSREDAAAVVAYLKALPPPSR